MSTEPDTESVTEPVTEPAGAGAGPGAQQPAGSTAEPVTEEMRLDVAGDRRREAGQAITTRAMARRLPQLIGRSLAMAWQVDRTSAIWLGVCQVLAGLLEALGLLAVSGTITAVIASGHPTHRLTHAAPSLIVLATAAAVRALLGITVTALSTRLAPRIAREAELRLIQAATGAELTAYDHPGYADRFEAADRGVEVSQELLTQAQNVIASTASLIAASAVLATVHPVLLPLLVLATVPQAVAGVRAARLTYLTSLDTMKDRRLLAVLRWHLVDKEVADQIRSGTMAGFLLGKYRDAGSRIDAANDNAAWRAAKTSIAGSLAGGLCSGGVWVVVLLLISSGRISLASAGTATFALRSVASGLRGIVSNGAIVFRAGLYLDDWADFLDEAGGHRIRNGTTVPAGPNLVRADHLTYTYPGAHQPALNDITLQVRSGEVLALVGENGSGKTTLGKLLSRLYLPAQGTVTWDGVDTRDLDAHAAWSRVAVVPQDYAEWPLTARENIILGQPAPGGDTTVRSAARASGADDVLTTLRSGLDTLLAREWWGGQQLSGGQWQRIALARAFHRPAGLLVLDEPTAALDPRAEHLIFTGLRELTGDRAVVLVTHRLANVAVADKVAVLDHGHLVQYGEFSQLRDAPGPFRDLWLLSHDRPARPEPAPDTTSTPTAAVSPPPTPSKELHR